MTRTEKVNTVQTLIGESESADVSLIAVYLDDAKEAILARRYPFGVPESVTDVPKAYERTQCKLAARYCLRRGAEGEMSHNEDGVSRAYGSVNDEDLLMEIVQVAKVG